MIRIIYRLHLFFVAGLVDRMATVGGLLMVPGHSWEACNTLAMRGGRWGTALCPLRTRATHWDYPPTDHGRVNLPQLTHTSLSPTSSFRDGIWNLSILGVPRGQGGQGEHGWGCDRAWPGWRGRQRPVGGRRVSYGFAAPPPRPPRIARVPCAPQKCPGIIRSLPRVAIRSIRPATKKRCNLDHQKNTSLYTE